MKTNKTRLALLAAPAVLALAGRPVRPCQGAKRSGLAANSRAQASVQKK